MNRRAFLSLSAISPLAHLLPAFGRSSQIAPRELACDVLICGGGVGGVACALAAARNGLKAIVTEETDWLGGQLTSQAVPPDEHPWIEQFGCTRRYRRFRENVRQEYRECAPLTPEAQNDLLLNPGGGYVSRLCFEPPMGTSAIDRMVGVHIFNHKLQVLFNHKPIAAQRSADRVLAVTVRNNTTGTDQTIEADYILDATELGDLLHLA